MKRRAGFTLLEVLVALAVLAIAMSAIIRAATQSIETAAVLREQTFASWVALNQINQLLLDAKPWPTEGSRTGKADLAGRVWRWEARFAKTDDPDLRRLEVTVRSVENGPVLSMLTAFKANPPQEPPAQNPDDPATRSPSPKDQPRLTPTPKTP